MTDLYEELGVEHDASEADIRAAYRRRAKQAHPDAGGTADEFERINRAKLVLLNSSRRQKYDETGKIDDSADDSLARAMNVVSNVIDEVLATIERKGGDIMNFDVVEDAKRVLDGRIRTSENHIVQSRNTIKTLKNIIKRFHTKKKNAPNRLASLFEARLKSAEDVLRNNQEIVASMKRAYEILSEHTFEYDVSSAPYSNYQQKIGSRNIYSEWFK